MSAPTTSAAVLVSVLVLGACGGRTTSSDLQVVRDTLGDTLVVRTVSGSVWGTTATLVPEVSIGEMEGDVEYLFGSVNSIAVGADGTIYVLDSQAHELRAYGADGVYRGTLGRPGEGPGELKQPNAVTILSDGRILVRDPGNGRLQTYAPDGTPAGAWPVVRGGFFTSSPLWSDRNDNVYIQVLLDPTADLKDWRMGLARIGPDGVAHDTLAIPRAGFEAPYVEARTEGGVSRSSVPFAATEKWILHIDGYFVHAVSTDYRIDLLRTNEPPLRIERAYRPVAVQAGEEAAQEKRITNNMRRMLPDWRWNGPSIPDHKPPFADILGGRDGRIWVRVSQPAVETENPDYDPKNPDSAPTRWTEPVVLDVFRPDGAYLGQVATPQGFSVFPAPVFDGDAVWAVTRDDLGVQRVVRYHVQRDAAPAD